MVTVGRGDFPEITFGEALKIAEVIHSKNIKTVEGLGKEMGYSPKSHGGTFYYKRMALSKHFRMVEPSKTAITLTHLGERMVSPLNEADARAAKQEAVLGVPLIKSLYDRLGRSFGPDDFRPALSQVSGLSPAEVATVASRIESVYRDAVEYIGGFSAQDETVRKSDRGSTNPPGDDRGSPAGTHGRPPATAFVGPVRILERPSHYNITVVLDPDVIEEAVVVLNALKAHVEAKRKASPTGSETPSG